MVLGRLVGRCEDGQRRREVARRVLLELVWVSEWEGTTSAALLWPCREEPAQRGLRTVEGRRRRVQERRAGLLGGLERLLLGVDLAGGRSLLLDDLAAVGGRDGADRGGEGLAGCREGPERGPEERHGASRRGWEGGERRAGEGWRAESAGGCWLAGLDSLAPAGVFGRLARRSQQPLATTRSQSAPRSRILCPSGR